MNLGFHEQLWWHVHFVGNVRNHKRTIWGIMCGREYLCCWRCFRGDGVLRKILGLYGNKLLKCFIPILLCPIAKGKELLRKEDLMENGSLL
jgi:hypothetical protein